MDEDDLLRPRLIMKIGAEVLPDTEHHRKLKIKREEEEKMRKDEIERKKKEQEQLDEQLAKASEAERQKAQAELKKKEEDEKRKKELQEVQDKLEGKLQIIKKKIKDNDSPYEYSFTDINIDSPSILMLCECLKSNTSLMILHISRKKLTDENGEEIAKMISVNKRLEKVDLEGNQLGPKAAKAFAQALKENTTLRYLDLESNCLCSNGDNSGVIELAEALQKNIKLLGLNISNNGLDEPCAQSFVSMLDANYYLIELDITFNYAIRTELVLEIMLRIKRNRKKYDIDRLNEWKERKQMKEELEGITSIMVESDQSKKKKLKDEIERLARQAKREAETKKKIEEFETQKEILLQQFQENALKRKKKGRKRRGGAKGGKGGKM